MVSRRTSKIGVVTVAKAKTLYRIDPDISSVLSRFSGKPLIHLEKMPTKQNLDVNIEVLYQAARRAGAFK